MTQIVGGMSSITPKTITTKSGQPVTIRSAEPDDAIQLIAFVHSVLAESPFFGLKPDEFDRTEDQERQWIQEHIDGPGKLVVLAEVSGTVIGCLSFDNGSYRRIAHRGSFGLSVRENWRGQGIGTVTLQALLDWATANPMIEKIGLSVFVNTWTRSGPTNGLGSWRKAASRARSSLGRGRMWTIY